MTERSEHKRLVARAPRIVVMPTTLGTANATLACLDDVLRTISVLCRKLLVVADKARQRRDETTVRRAQESIRAMSISFANLSGVRDKLMTGIEDLTMLSPTPEMKALLDDLFERLVRNGKP